MDKAIITALFTIGGVVAALAVINAVYPAISRGSGAVSSMSAKVDDRIKSQVEIVHATGELDENQDWQDTDSDGYFDTLVWVKNVGATKLDSIKEADVFFGPEGNFVRIPHVDDAGGGYPSWDYQIENSTEWTATATVQFIVHETAPCTPAPCSAPAKSGTYFVKIVTSNGVSDEHFFSL